MDVNNADKVMNDINELLSITREMVKELNNKVNENNSIFDQKK